MTQPLLHPWGKSIAPVAVDVVAAVAIDTFPVDVDQPRLESVADGPGTLRIPAHVPQIAMAERAPIGQEPGAYWPDL